MHRLVIMMVLAAYAPTISAADKLLVEKLVLQSPERGGARVVGIIRNNSDDLIVLPVLEVVCVTKEQPDVPIAQRLVMSACLHGREARAFHTGEFFGPPVRTPDGDAVPQRIIAIKSSRILPGSMTPASSDWLARTAGRESLTYQIREVELRDDEWWLTGTVAAPSGTRAKSLQFTVSCFDETGDLVDVRTFLIQRRDQDCIDQYPYEFPALASRFAKQLGRASVKCICEQVSRCP